ncbi:heme ABC transporter permease [Salinisphaera sp. Q1T1-3]|uniref:heme ABC transporter permease n=1 Tax=Salinisphaera sp. Q1T1-3 TaxID=2321229 RepID=UPI000E7678A5|nr:heme ABC transporter permease [Salinisphaera sp. Q1T1-3]
MATSAFKRWFHRFGSLPYFYGVSRSWARWLAVPGLVLAGYAVFAGLVLVPADYQQGDVFRILYIHVPSAWLSLFGYTAMAVAGVITLVWRLKLAEIFIVAAAPIGASFTFLALVTGAIWGKPTWGTFWVWDARLTSELILLFLYLGVIALHQAIESPRTAARACALLSIVGVVNVPIIHYSVVWWTTLHQGATVKLTGGSHMESDMLWPLLAGALGFTLIFGWLTLWGMRVQLLWRERRSRWVMRMVQDG